MRRSCLLLLLVAVLLVSAQVCRVDIGTDQSSQCVRGKYCTHLQYNGSDPVSGDPHTVLGCGQCDVALGGAVPSAGVYDLQNFCNCHPGMFCRQSAPSVEDQPSLLARCEASTMMGTLNCSVDNDCEGVRERSADGGNTRRERGYCNNGVCTQCNRTLFIASFGAASYTCRGYTLLANGQRYYHSARPGVVMTCHPDGWLTSSGSVNMELLDSTEQVSPSMAPTHTGSRVATTTKEEEGKEPAFVPALLAVNLIISTATLACLTCLAIALLVVYVRRRQTPARIQGDEKLYGH
jgi:hypothetical protein